MKDSKSTSNYLNQALESTLGELRFMGWHVTEHHEFKMHDQLRTFRIFTHPCGKWIKAEGAANSELLVLRRALGDALDHHCDNAASPSP